MAAKTKDRAPTAPAANGFRTLGTGMTDGSAALGDPSAALGAPPSSDLGTANTGGSAAPSAMAAAAPMGDTSPYAALGQSSGGGIAGAKAPDASKPIEYPSGYVPAGAGQSDTGADALKGPVQDDWWSIDPADTNDAELNELAGEIPDWARFPGSGFENATPAEFRNYLMSLDPEVRSAFIMDLRASGEAWAATIAERDAATEIISGERERVQSGMAAWESDPFRAAYRNALLERTDPNYSVMSPQQIAAAELQIAQQTQLARRNADASAAGRGTAGGGAQIGLDAALDAYGNLANTTLKSNIDATNEQSRLAATTALGQLTGQDKQIDLAYSGALSQLAAEEAAMHNNIQYVPKDFAVWEELEFSLDQAREEAARFEREHERLVQAEEKDLYDWLGLVAEFSGTGLFAWLGNVLGGLFPSNQQ